LDIWAQLALAFPLKWTALLPLMAIGCQAAAVPEAIPLVEAILHDSQQQLPGASTDSLRRFLRCAADGDTASAQNALQLALRLLDRADFR
jgi:hypothetical protein